MYLNAGYCPKLHGHNKYRCDKYIKQLPLAAFCYPPDELFMFRDIVDVTVGDSAKKQHLQKWHDNKADREDLPP
jgi:hypothetical protein